MSERLWFVLHNLVGHPLMEILGLFKREWGEWIHRMTLPPKYR